MGTVPVAKPLNTYLLLGCKLYCRIHTCPLDAPAWPVSRACTSTHSIMVLVVGQKVISHTMSATVQPFQAEQPSKRTLQEQASSERAAADAGAGKQ